MDGVAVDAETGQPLENVTVRISRGKYCCGPSEAGVTSDADGKFSAPLKSLGNYSIWVHHDGYVTDWSQSMTNCSPCNVTVSLHREAKVRGRVITADTHEPIGRIAVEAIQVTYPIQGVSAIPTSRAMTFNDGVFSLAQLPPGQYYFRFTPAVWPAELIVPDKEEPAARPLIAQWWPGGDTYRGATPFTVMAGTTFSMPDIAIPVAALFQVSGTVQKETCHSDESYKVSIGSLYGNSFNMFRSMVVRCGSEFAFGNLAPGRYQLSLPGGIGTEVLITDSSVRKDLQLQ